MERKEMLARLEEIIALANKMENCANALYKEVEGVDGSFEAEKTAKRIRKMARSAFIYSEQDFINVPGFNEMAMVGFDLSKEVYDLTVRYERINERTRALTYKMFWCSRDICECSMSILDVVNKYAL